MFSSLSLQWMLRIELEWHGLALFHWVNTTCFHPDLTFAFDLEKIPCKQVTNIIIVNTRDLIICHLTYKMTQCDVWRSGRDWNCLDCIQFDVSPCQSVIIKGYRAEKQDWVL